MPEPSIPAEPMWAFRQHAFGTGEFNTALAHYYRAEIQRSNTWRTRLDATTNWAIITAGAAISFALSAPEHHHGVILINFILIGLFLFIEARRYRYYELWAYRTRLIEQEYLAAMLVSPHQPAPDWADKLATSLRTPRFPISLREALGRRIRRNYGWIFLTLVASWLLKLITQPTALFSLNQFVERAAVGPFAGEWIIALVGTVMLALTILGVTTVMMRRSVGEVFDPSLFDAWIKDE